MQSTAERPQRRSAYDPGQPAGIERLSFREGTFLVKPFQKKSGPQKDGEYLVDLNHQTCTCEHHQYRIAPAREKGEEAPDCKHFDLAREESRRIALHVARTFTATELRTQLLRTDLRPEIHEAVQQVTWERMWARANRPGALSFPALLDTLSRASQRTASAR